MRARPFVVPLTAIAAGIADGMGFGDNTKASLITRGLAEIIANRRTQIVQDRDFLAFFSGDVLGVPTLVVIFALVAVAGAVLDQLSGERDDLKIVKINIDEHMDHAMEQRVMMLPTVVLFKGGEVVSNRMGAAPKAALKTWIDESI